MPLTVNGETIDPMLIDSEFSQIKAFYEQQANVSCCERDDEFLGYAKENLIARVLLSKAAEAEQGRPDEKQIDARISELEEQAGGKEQFLYSLGLTPGDEGAIREDVGNSLQLEGYIDQISAGLAVPDSGEIEAYYKEHEKSFHTEEEVRAAHIFKSLQQVEKRDDLFEELREIRHRLLAGEDFMGLARECSDKPADEIDLGFFKRGELMDEFELITFSLEVGDITPVFATQWGLHLAKVTDRKVPELRPLGEVREDIIEEISAKERDRLIKEHVDGLKEKAEIEDTPDDESEDEDGE